MRTRRSNDHSGDKASMTPCNECMLFSLIFTVFFTLFWRVAERSPTNTLNIDHLQAHPATPLSNKNEYTNPNRIDIRGFPAGLNESKERELMLDAGMDKAAYFSLMRQTLDTKATCNKTCTDTGNEMCLRASGDMRLLTPSDLVAHGYKYFMFAGDSITEESALSLREWAETRIPNERKSNKSNNSNNSNSKNNNSSNNNRDTCRHRQHNSNVTRDRITLDDLVNMTSREWARRVPCCQNDATSPFIATVFDPMLVRGNLTLVAELLAERCKCKGVLWLGHGIWYMLRDLKKADKPHIQALASTLRITTKTVPAAGKMAEHSVSISQQLIEREGRVALVAAQLAGVRRALNTAATKSSTARKELNRLGSGNSADSPSESGSLRVVWQGGGGIDAQVIAAFPPRSNYWAFVPFAHAQNLVAYDAEAIRQVEAMQEPANSVVAARAGKFDVLFAPVMVHEAKYPGVKCDGLHFISSYSDYDCGATREVVDAFVQRVLNVLVGNVDESTLLV